MTLRVALAGAPDKTPPAEFRIFPFGPIATTRGTFLFDREAAASVMARYRDHATDLSMDYEHAALKDAGAISHGAPAAAWFQLELRKDGLWATRVKWTPDADRYLRQGEYRYFSPAFAANEKTGRIERLVNIALTNLPATKGMTPLVAAKDPLMEPEEMKQALAAHLAAMEEHRSEMQTCRDEMTDMRDRLKARADGPDAAREDTGGVQTLGARQEGELIALRDRAERGEAALIELRALKAQLLEREVAQLVDEGIKSGKMDPAKREWALSEGLRSPEMLRGYLDATLRSPLFSEHQEPPLDKPAVLLSEDDRRIAALVGVTPEAFAATAQRLS
jgi:phage I-like protein